MINRTFTTIALATGMLMLVACSKSTPTPTSSEQSSAVAQAEQPTSIDLKLMDLAQVKERIAQLNGKYVIVDLWALW